MLQRGIDAQRAACVQDDVRALRVAIAALDLEPKPDWAGGLRAMWSPGESAAQERLARFASGALSAYPTGRDQPSADGSSLMAPHLAFGEIGIRRVWHTAAKSASSPAESTDKFHAELLWREFATHVLVHFKHWVPNSLMHQEMKLQPL